MNDFTMQHPELAAWLTLVAVAAYYFVRPALARTFRGLAR